MFGSSALARSLLSLALLDPAMAAVAADATPAQAAPAAQPAPAAQAPAPPAEVGLWQTISDKTGKPEGYIRIAPVGDELRGTIERGMPGDDPNELCTKCPGERKNQRKIGMTIITGLHRKDGSWVGGEILDPDSGTLYRCRIRATDAGRKLEVRGYIGISLLGRTQTWLRAE
ncbi:MAG TPA: DUF2147 domain-containing protein [Burkholderiaceae bacterium]|nr:DUF2147 domain-containing protein [Burkholderiaceae bacterium]